MQHTGKHAHRVLQHCAGNYHRELAVVIRHDTKAVPKWNAGKDGSVKAVTNSTWPEERAA
eukprot:scaffold60241_cov26-Tisochrysis_lutea.AAC.2